MCLKSEKLGMQYNSHLKKYIGQGYKTGYDFDGLKVRGARILKIGKWYDAFKLQKDIEQFTYQTGLMRIYSDESKTYHAGFHIFLNPKHAKIYGGTKPVWLVEYYDVIGFGKNKFNQENASGPCVIAHKMRVIRKIDKSEIK